jgi:hypothetical protein
VSAEELLLQAVIMNADAIKKSVDKMSDLFFMITGFKIV